MVCMQIPTAFIYHSYSGYENYPNQAYAQFTLGNLGFSGAHCSSSPLLTDNLHLQCASGFIDEIGSIGIIPWNSNSSIVCLSSMKEAQTCNELFDNSWEGIKALNDYFYKNCYGRSQCSINNISGLYLPEVDSLKNEKLKDCLNEKSFIFMNNKCVKFHEGLEDKRFKCWIVASLCVAVTVVYFLLMIKTWKD